jgi:glycosyltransferase involved in cell wall biosynthesis
MNTIRVNIIPHPSSIGRGIGFYTQFLQKALSKLPQLELTANQPDLLHYTFFDLFYPTLPQKQLLPTVVTVHDVTPLVLKSFYPQGIRGRVNLFLQKKSLRKAAAIITDSLNSKSDIHRYLGIPLEKIYSIPLAADPIYSQSVPAKQLQKVKKKYDLPNTFVLFVGGVNPNKNIVRLIEATQSLNMPLVLVGSEFTKEIKTNSLSIKQKIGLQPLHPELKEADKVRQLVAVSPNIYTPGFVASKDLAAIYRLATVYCQPSLYEGFGMPLVEAMLSGCLIITSNTSSLPELYPPRTITFDPSSSLSLTKALETVVSLSPKERADLIKKTSSYVKQFNWQKTAAETLRVYQQVLGL